MQYESTAMEFLHTQTQLNRFIVTHFIQMKATHFQLKRSIQIFQINFIDLPKRNFIECLRCTIFFLLFTLDSCFRVLFPTVVFVILNGKAFMMVTRNVKLRCTAWFK